MDIDIQTCNVALTASVGIDGLGEKVKELNMGLEKLSRDLLTIKEKCKAMRCHKCMYF